MLAQIELSATVKLTAFKGHWRFPKTIEFLFRNSAYDGKPVNLQSKVRSDPNVSQRVPAEPRGKFFFL